jgi:hypothetical protein
VDDWRATRRSICRGVACGVRLSEVHTPTSLLVGMLNSVIGV